MEVPRRILVLVDPTLERTPAVDKAATLARAFRAQLDLLICIPEPAIPRAPQIDESTARAVRVAARRPHEQQLSALAARLSAEGLECSTRVELGRPLHETMLAVIGDVRPDLVVKDTHHHALLRRTLLGNTDWHLIRDCTTPLLLVKARPWAMPPRVVAAVDPGHPNDEPAALDHALIDAATRLARGLDSTAELLHFWSPVAELATMAVGAPGGVVMPVSPDLVEISARLDEERLAHLARVHDVPPSRVHRLEGSVRDGMPAAAENMDIDVLALGAVARSALQHAFVGSTAERLLESLPCDVLVVNVRPGDARRR